MALNARRVRLGLTELGVDWVAWTIPLDRAGRAAMEEATGTRSIPTLVDGETVVHGPHKVIGHLDRHRAEPADAGRHLAQTTAEWPHRVGLHG